MSDLMSQRGGFSGITVVLVEVDGGWVRLHVHVSPYWASQMLGKIMAGSTTLCFAMLMNSRGPRSENQYRRTNVASPRRVVATIS